MISASANSLMPDFSGLTADISRSVSTIKAKAQVLRNDSIPSAQNQSAGSAFKSFSLNNYAVSYLEPQALYSLHRFVAETDDAEKLKQQNRRPNIFKDDENAAPESAGETNPDDKISFWEEFSQNLNGTILRQTMEAYGVQSSAVDSSAAFLAAATPSKVSGSYAAGAYDYVFNINTEPKVLIDFMHEFNRSYDYKI